MKWEMVARRRKRQTKTKRRGKRRKGGEGIHLVYGIQVCNIFIAHSAKALKAAHLIL